MIIPSYNEEDNIGKLIQDIRDKNIQDIIVIDDGSSDNTADIVQSLQVLLIRHKFNEGKGKCIRQGLNLIKDRDFDAVVLMDADGQHTSEDLIKIIKFSKDSSALLILGNRMENPHNMPRIRRHTNKIMSCIISRIIGQHVSDSQCGFRLLKRGLIRNLKIESSNYEIESEIIIKTAKLGYKIESVPIQTIYKNEISKINPILDTLRFIKLLIRLSLSKENRSSADSARLEQT